MSMDISPGDELQSITAQHQEAARSRDIVIGAMALMGWTAAVVVLVIGSLVSNVGWIPESLTQPNGIFETHGFWPYIAGALGFALVVRFLRFRALVRLDARSERTADLSEFAFGGLLCLAVLVGLIGLYGVVASVWLKTFGLPSNISTLVSGAIGLAVVGAAYVVSLLAHRWRWPLIAEDSELGGVVGGAIALLLALPLAWLFGFYACVFILIALERVGIDVEPLRAFFHENTLMFPTTGFLALTGIIHTARRAPWRDAVGGPNFVGTMMLTGTFVFVAVILLIAFTGMK